MRKVISDWLNSRQAHLSVFEGDDEIIFRHQGDTLLLGAQLTSTRSDNPALQRWMRLGGASLSHFHGALAQKADSGALWLIQTLRAGQGETDVLGCLEALLNQRDTWRATFARLAPLTEHLKPTSLRSLSY